MPHLTRSDPGANVGPASARIVAVVDVGATAVRLVVAEIRDNEPPQVLEEASRAVLLGKDTFSSGRIGAETIESTLRTLDGFRRMMDAYGVTVYRAVATSAVREAANADTFLDRVRVRTGLDIEVIDGSEESRLTFLAVQAQLRGHPALAGIPTLLVEVGGGGADVTLIEGGRPKYSGVFALGSIRMRQSLGPWHGGHDQRVRLLARHVSNLVADIRRDVPLKSAQYVVALGHDMRFVASQVADTEPEGTREISREAFLAFVERVEALDDDQLVERFRLTQADAETLVPALLVYRNLLMETSASALVVPDASLRAGLLIDLVGQSAESTFEEFSRQVLASAEALGEKYRYDARHAKNVAHLAGRLSTACDVETDCCWRWRRCSTTSERSWVCVPTTSTRSTCWPRPRSSGCLATMSPSSRTWRATTAGGCRRDLTCHTWPWTAKTGCARTSSGRCCGWPTRWMPSTCRRSETST
jgi:exopolyphosphatase/guanosine-5'-triphosphate,3'-diphosphate pyrophosphatase